MTRLILICLGLILASPLWAAKHAFIVGNGAYAELSDLRNTRADAKAYKQAFGDLGFDVTYHEDLELNDMADAFEAFLAKVAPGDEVAFVFSGHGWSDGATNYLIPTDAPVQGSDFSLKRASYALSDGRDGFLDRIKQAGAGLSVAIIDACRNNPFKADPAKKSVSLSRGLARVEAAQGSFVIFSAGEGQEALDRLPDDGTDSLSVFTRNFLPRLMGGLYLEDAISEAQVETAVMAATYNGHQQHPAYYDQTLGKTCLSGTCQGAVQVAQPINQCDALYAEAKASNACFAYSAYRTACTSHLFHPIAESFLAANCTAQPPEPILSEVVGWTRRTLKHGPTKFQGKKNEIYTVLSPNAEKLATLGIDQNLYIWDVETGKVTHRLKEHWRFSRLSFSPNGRWVLSRGREGVLRVWDLENIGSDPVFETVSAPYHVPIFSPDSSLLLVKASEFNKPSRLLRTADWSDYPNFTVHTDAGAVAFTRDGDEVLSVSRSRVLVASLKTGEHTMVAREDVASDVLDVIPASRDGMYVVLNVEAPPQIFSNALSERKHLKIETDFDAYSVAADGKKLHMANKAGQIETKSLISGELEHSRKFSHQPVLFLEFSKDGGLLFHSDEPGLLHAHDTETGATLPLITYDGDKEAYSWDHSQDGMTHAFGSSFGQVTLLTPQFK